MSILHPKEEIGNPLITFKLNDNYAGIKEFIYKMTGKAYFDMRFYRGYKQIGRIITPDTGFTDFTVEGVGTFCIPNEQEMMEQFFNKKCTYLNYKINNSKAVEVMVENTKPIKYQFPILSPSELQAKMEAKTVIDLLSEPKKDMGWIIWLMIGIVGIVAVMIIFGGM